MTTSIEELPAPVCDLKVLFKLSLGNDCWQFIQLIFIRMKKMHAISVDFAVKVLELLLNQLYVLGWGLSVQMTPRNRAWYDSTVQGRGQT